MLLGATDQNKHSRAASLARQVLQGRFPPRPSRASALQVRQVQHRLTAAEVDQIAEQYREGTSTYALAKQWKINRDTVTLALRRAGIATRRPRALTPQQLAEARRLQEEGWSLNRLGRHFGVDPKTMKRRLAFSAD